VKRRETLDEAIDRVASRMTQRGDGDGGEIRAVWTSPSAYRWLGWRGVAVAGVAAAAVLIAVTLVRGPAVDEGDVGPSLGGSPLMAWSPLRAPIVDTGGGIAEGRAVRVARAAGPIRADSLREPGVTEGDGRPTFGIPLLEAPSALAVPAQTMTGIDIDAVGEIETIEVAPLSVDAISDDRENEPKEQ
jgi:hypothetical protein